MAEVIAAVGRYPEGITPKDPRTLLPDISKSPGASTPPVRNVSSVSLPFPETHKLTQLTPQLQETY